MHPVFPAPSVFKGATKIANLGRNGPRDRGRVFGVIVREGRLDAGVLLLPKPYLSSDLARMIRTALAS